MSKFKLISDLKSEFKKVTWLAKAELLLQSRVVLSSILLIGCLVYTADIVVQTGLSLVAGVMKLIMR